MLQKLVKRGNSIYLRMQRDWLRENGLKEGDNVTVRENIDGQIVILKPEGTKNE